MPDAISRLTDALADRYRIEREIGAGGMATVYLAEDLKHNRRVAIKVLRPELGALLGADRFLAEIRTTANLQHPNILPLFDSGALPAGDSLTTHDSRLLFYVMPYVDGESLRARLTREKQLPITDAVRIATEVAGALDYAHRHNVIHRDIKPENILLHDGRALVADFGIALAATRAGGARMTETGMSLGTPAYMSPEQAMGEREITGRADIYALGCVTYEMLVGEPPFTGPTAQAIVAKVVTTPAPSLRTARHSVPEPVETAVLIALEKLPADRWGTAKEFAEALVTSRPHVLTSSRHPERSEGSPRPPPRSPPHPPPPPGHPPPPPPPQPPTPPPPPPHHALGNHGFGGLLGRSGKHAQAPAEDLAQGIVRGFAQGRGLGQIALFDRFDHAVLEDIGFAEHAP